MVPDNTRHILVTGSHRSATTFTAKILSLDSSLGYINEPFNVDSGMEGLKHWFQYIEEGMDDGGYYNELVHNLLTGNASFKRTPYIRKQGLFKNIAKYFLKSKSNYLYKLATINPLKNRYLIKDPIACLSSLYLSTKYHMDVVMLIRHPASFCASIKRLNWRFDFNEFKSQPLLMDHYLGDILNGHDISSLNIVTEAALVWKCLYTVLFDFIENDKSIIAIKHESVSQNPVKEFRHLYNRLGLHYNDKVERKIIDLTSSSNIVMPENNIAHEFKRSSKLISSAWKKSLTQQEVDTIYQITSDLSASYYADSEW